jgi:hypothetical protein
MSDQQPTQPVVEETADDRAPSDDVRPALRLSRKTVAARCGLTE